MNNNKKNILVLGHFGGYNFGDDVMLLAFINEIIVKINCDRIIVISKKSIPLISDKIKVKKPKILEVIYSIFECNTVVVCGGTHFEDSYNSLRYMRHLRYMLYFVFVITFAKKMKKRTILLGNGFGPIEKIPTKVIFKILLKNTDLVTTRDKESYNIVKEYNKSKLNLWLAFDLAFPLINKYRRESYKQDKILGISLTNVINRIDDYNDKIILSNIKTLVNKVCQESSFKKIKIFAFRGGERESDIEISTKVFRILSQLKENYSISLHIYDNNPIEFIEEMSYCSHFIASRYHSALAAYALGLNLLVLPYHKKLIDFITYISSVDQNYLPNYFEINVDQNQCRFMEEYSLGVEDALKLSMLNYEQLMRVVN